MTTHQSYTQQRAVKAKHMYESFIDFDRPEPFSKRDEAVFIRHYEPLEHRLDRMCRDW